MPNINLNLATENESEYKPKVLSGSLFFSIAVIVVPLLIYGGLLIYGRSLSAEIEKTADEYKVQSSEFSSGNASQVLDFFNRSKIAGDFLSGDQSGAEIIAELEKAILPNVYLTSLQYDEKNRGLKLACVGDNFSTIAKQVLSFKQSEYFSSVTPGVSVVDPQDGSKINFAVELRIK